MKKLLLILCLLSMTAHAEWSFVTPSNDNSFDQYIDKSTVKTMGNQRTFWDMVNYKKPLSFEKGKLYKSTKSLKVIDCKSIKSDM